MINAGAIITCSMLKTLVKPEMTLAEKFDYTLAYFQVLAICILCHTEETQTCHFIIFSAFAFFRVNSSVFVDLTENVWRRAVWFQQRCFLVRTRGS